MNVVDFIQSQPSWGRKQVQALPYADAIKQAMVEADKTVMSSKDIKQIMFNIVANKLGYTYHFEFIALLEQQKPTMSKETAQNILRQFWENTKEDYRHNPVLFNLIKNTLIEINKTLSSNNGRRVIINQFIDSFLIHSAATA